MANDILVKIGADITEFSRKMAESNEALSNFGKANAETFDAFKKTGAVVTGAGVALAGGLGFAVKTASNFESAMSSVKAISGATGKDFELLSAKAREMGASTSFSASEAAEGLEYMALAGWNTQQMLGGIEPILHLAEAGALDLGRASDLVTDSMSALGIEVKDLDGYLDKVAKTAASANTDIDALMEAFVIAGGTFERFNVPLSEANAFLGVMANRGFKGSEAGTALNTIMARLTASTGPSAKALKELGVNAFDAEGNFRGMEVVMKEVESALSELTDEERAHYQTQIAGLNHGKAFSAMLSGLGNEYDDLKAAIIDSDGALINMRNTMIDNLQGALGSLSSAFEEMQIALGSALLPAIKVLVKGLQFLADRFNALPDSVKSFIAIGAALASVLLVVGGGILLLVGFIPQIISGFVTLKTVALAIGGALSSISAPVLIVIALIGALIATVVYAYRESEAFREAISIAFNAIKVVIMTVIGAVAGFIQEVWGFIVGWWEENNETIMSVAIKVWDGISTAITTVMEYLAPFLEGAWLGIQTVVQVVWEFIKTIVMVAMEFIGGIISAVMLAIDGDWSGAWEKIQDTFTKIWERIKAFGEKVVTIIKDNLKDKFEEMKRLITVKLTEARDNLVKRFNEMKDNAIKRAQEILTNIRNKFTEMVSSVRDKMTEIRDKIEEMMKKAIDYLKGIDLVQVGKDIIKGLINGIGSMSGAVWNKAKDIAKGIGDSIKKTLGIRSPSRVLMEIGKWTTAGLAKGIEDYAYLVDKASDMLAESAIPDVKNIDLSYATPDGIKTSLASAVSGTVGVKTRDDALVHAIYSLERRLTNLEVVMDGREVGRIVEPYVTEEQERNQSVRNRFRG